MSRKAEKIIPIGREIMLDIMPFIVGLTETLKTPVNANIVVLQKTCIGPIKPIRTILETEKIG